MAKRMKIREIAWDIGGSHEKTLLYASGKFPPDAFLAECRKWSCDCGNDLLEPLKDSDVQYLRFRPMSPSEAKSRGYDTGVMDCTGEPNYRGYAVTAVFV